MSYSIIQYNSSDKKLTVSYDPILSNIIIDVPEYFISSDGLSLVESTELDSYINGFAPTEEYINIYKNYLQELADLKLIESVPLSISSVYVPSYLKFNQNFSSYINGLYEEDKIVLLDDTMANQAEYTVKYDWEQDLIAHQLTRSPDSDNYIYFRNRLAFLHHIKSYATKVWPGRVLTGEIDPSGFRKPIYIPFCVPKSKEELENFLSTDKKYRISTSIDKIDFTQEYTSSEILDFFDVSYFEQNQINQNVISLNPIKKIYIIEESFGIDFDNMTGFATRPRLSAEDLANVYKPARVTFDIEVEIKDIVTLRMFLSHCFYYYATPFQIKYQTNSTGEFIPLEVDVAMDFQNPRLDLIYFN
jgi:hypothetical protein